MLLSSWRILFTFLTIFVASILNVQEHHAWNLFDYTIFELYKKYILFTFEIAIKQYPGKLFVELEKLPL